MKNTSTLKPDLSNITQALYIKLGSGGEWENLCINDGTLRIGYDDVPHDLAMNKNAETLRNHLISNAGYNPKSTNNHIRQVLDFYHAGQDTLWITFSNGFMWWCISNTQVQYTGNRFETMPEGSHLRQTISGWSNHSLTNRPLQMSDMSGRFTKVAGYRGTICSVDKDYALRKLLDIDLPEVMTVKKHRDELLSSTMQLIQNLTWQDFELFVELLFSQSGWRRISSIGKTQKTLDIELELPSTNERAIVQIKSQTTQKQFDSYHKEFLAMGADKYFYIYHTGNDIQSINSKITIINNQTLARMAFKAGLVDWLIDKVN